jgi:hypothetical protein
MSNEIVHRYDGTGAALYAVLSGLDGQHWNTATPGMEAYDKDNWTDYDVALTESPASGYVYVADIPTNFPIGRFVLRIFDRSDASPALTDMCVFEREVWWDGKQVSNHGAIPPGKIVSVP